MQCYPIDHLPLSDTEKEIAIIGFQCDEGVKRNKGRIGAGKAPDEIRKYLANLPYHLEEDSNIIDVGNVVCEDGNLEESQRELGLYVRELLYQSKFPIILGGGHETLFGHYLGARAFLGDEPSLGIINIDAHFDLRVEPFATSGTMFKQILDKDHQVGYLALGIQRFGNTKKLFETAEAYHCTYLYEEEVEKIEQTIQVIDRFSQTYDYMILTLCFDAIHLNAAPGVSAPSPFGLEPKTVRKLLRYIAKKENLLSFDLSEVNPQLDENGKTARLAAYLLAELMMSMSDYKL